MSWTIDIENIAGILDGTTVLQPGKNAVRGSNWQGKSSFIESLKTALGVSAVLTEGKQSGRVELRTDEETVTVSLQRSGDSDGVRQTGEALLTEQYDLVRAELFACLDEYNEIRQAVRDRDGSALESVLLRPLAVQNIEERIATLRDEREGVEAELSQAREAVNRLPRVRKRVERLEDEIATLGEQQAKIPGHEASRQDESHLRGEHEQTQTRITRLERSIERTEERLSEKRTEHEELPDPEDADFEAELTAARETLQELKRDVEVLQSVYSANQLVLNENRMGLVSEIEHEMLGDQVSCWICGNEASKSEIQEGLQSLGKRITELRAEIESHRDAVEELEAQREEARQARKRKQELEASITEMEATLSDRKASLSQARDRLAELAEQLTDRSDELDESVEEITDVKSEMKYREMELEEAREEVESLKDRESQLETLEEEHNSLSDEIESLRSRKEDLKRRAREEFDAAIKEITERFDAGFESARLTADFDLVVARDGREASLDALSEGELELLGFVAALAGYESFDVNEVAPVLLLDGLGGLADENLHTLIEYLEGRAAYLVFTAYPEHEPFDGNEISPSEWEIAHSQSGKVG